MDLNRILVPLDGSRKSQALDIVQSLAGFTHGHVTCIHVPRVIDGVHAQRHLINNSKKMEKHYSKKQKNEQENKM